MPAKKVFIYGLIDPRTGQVRYVGKAKDLFERVARHLEPRQLTSSCHRAHWLRQLVIEGLKPDIVIIEECQERYWESREKYWIAYYRRYGCDLTNSTDGGDGIHNPSAGFRQKMGDATSWQVYAGRRSYENIISTKG